MTGMAEVTLTDVLKLAIAHHQANRLADAEVIYRQILSSDPNQPDALQLLGLIALRSGRSQEAVDLIRRALAIHPNWADAQYNFAVALKETGHHEAATAAYRRAVQLDPRNTLACSALAHCLQKSADDLHNTGQLDQAIAAYREAISLKPGSAAAHNNLANALIDIGDTEAATAEYRTAVALDPSNASIHSALVCSLNYHPAIDEEIHRAEKSLWNARHGEPPRQPHENERTADRRLRIGYVSPDFRNHPVGRFLLPLLENHDHRQVEIFCYCNAAVPDSVTARFRKWVDHWREIHGQPHDQVASIIREDRIDILVDLSGHSTGNRLPVFARKAAPVQISWLGYPASAGLRAIDYRMTDIYADQAEEGLIRLPRTNWCFAAHDESPPVAPPPSVEAGYVTFGCANLLAKVNRLILEIWAGILHEIPDSRLLLKAAGLVAQSARDRVSRTLSALGIDLGRVSLMGPQGDYQSHLAVYSQIDIALDTFPYHGTTTTCEALWMGLPVITLAGKTHVSRVGVSLLTNLGLPELITDSVEAYVQCAINLAHDTGRRIQLRETLRNRMKHSPLMDAESFARDVESAYRQMWIGWAGGVTTVENLTIVEPL